MKGKQPAVEVMKTKRPATEDRKGKKPAAEEMKMKRPATEDRKGKKPAAEEMKASMSRLQQQDPEFYEFLQKEDEELLNFDAASEDEDGEEEADEGEEEEEAVSRSR